MSSDVIDGSKTSKKDIPYSQYLAEAKEELARMQVQWGSEFVAIANQLLQEPKEIRLLCAETFRVIAKQVNELANSLEK